MRSFAGFVFLLTVAFVADSSRLGYPSNSIGFGNRDSRPRLRLRPRRTVSDKISKHGQFVLKRSRPLRSYDYEATKDSGMCVGLNPAHYDDKTELAESNVACCDQINQRKTKKPKVYGCCCPTCKRPGHTCCCAIHARPRSSSARITSHGRSCNKLCTCGTENKAASKMKRLSTRNRKFRPHRYLGKKGMRHIIDRTQTANDNLPVRPVDRNTDQDTDKTHIKPFIMMGFLPENSKGYEEMTDLLENARNETIESNPNNLNEIKATNNDQAAGSVAVYTPSYIYTDVDVQPLPIPTLDSSDEIMDEQIENYPLMESMKQELSLNPSRDSRSEFAPEMNQEQEPNQPTDSFSDFLASHGLSVPVYKPYNRQTVLEKKSYQYISNVPKVKYQVNPIDNIQESPTAYFMPNNEDYNVEDFEGESTTTRPTPSAEIKEKPNHKQHQETSFAKVKKVMSKLIHEYLKVQHLASKRQNPKMKYYTSGEGLTSQTEMQGAQSSDYRKLSLDEAIPSSNEVRTSAEEELDDKDTLRNIVPQPTDGTDSSNEVGQENRHRCVRKHRYFGNRDWKLSRPREHLSKNNVKGVRQFQKLPYTHDKGDYTNKGILQIHGQGHRYNKQGGQVNRVQKPDQTCSKEEVNMEEDLETGKNCYKYTEGEIMKGDQGEVHKNSNKPYDKEGDTKKRDQEPINQSSRYTDPVLNALNNAGEANTTVLQSYENISMIVPVPHKEAEDVQSTDIDDKDGALPEMASTVNTDQIFEVTEEGFEAELEPGEEGDPGDIQDETAETEVDYYEESTVDLDEEDGEEATTYDTIDEVYEVTEKGFTVGLKPGEVGDPGDIEDDADYEDSYDDEDFFDATEVVTQPIDPQGWYGWSLWSACSVSCGKGQLTRTRLCGARCEDGATQEIEIKPCHMPPCRSFSLLDLFRPRGRKIFY